MFPYPVSFITNSGGGGFDNTYSLAFDGVDDYVKASLDGTSTGGILPASDSDIELTISFWFYMDGSQSLKGIFQWGNSLIDTTPTLLVNTDGASIRTFVDGSYRHTSGITMNAWHHYAITRTASTNTWQGYIDGVSAFTANDGGTLNDRASAIDFYFGVGYNGYLNGKIDEAAFWNSVQDVAAIYNSGVPNDISSLNPTLWLRNGDNGSYKSPQWLIPNNSNKDKISNYSFSYDGVDDNVNLGDIPFVRAGGQYFSISAWVNTNSSAQGAYFGTRVAPLSTNVIYFYKNSAGGVVLYISNSSTGNIEARSSVTLSNNQWYHIAATFDGSEPVATDRIKIYINGILSVGYQSGTGTNLPSGSTGIFNFIGALNVGLYQSGNIDEVAIWDSTLTSGNVTTIYNSGTPADLSSLSPVGYWRSENSTFSTNWTVTDNGSGSSNGTSANMTIEDRVGDASNSTSNAISFNMTESDRETDVPT